MRSLLVGGSVGATIGLLVYRITLPSRRRRLLLVTLLALVGAIIGVVLTLAIGECSAVDVEIKSPCALDFLAWNVSPGPAIALSAVRCARRCAPRVRRRLWVPSPRTCRLGRRERCPTWVTGGRQQEEAWNPRKRRQRTRTGRPSIRIHPVWIPSGRSAGQTSRMGAPSPSPLPTPQRGKSLPTRSSGTPRAQYERDPHERRSFYTSRCDRRVVDAGVVAYPDRATRPRLDGRGRRWSQDRVRAQDLEKRGQHPRREHPQQARRAAEARGSNLRGQTSPDERCPRQLGEANHPHLIPMDEAQLLAHVRRMHARGIAQFRSMSAKELRRQHDFVHGTTSPPPA